MSNRSSGISSGEADYYELGRWDASHGFNPREVHLDVSLAPYLRKINEGGDLAAITREVYEKWAEVNLSYAAWLPQQDRKDIATARLTPERAYEQWRKGYRGASVRYLERFLKQKALEHPQEGTMRGNPRRNAVGGPVTFMVLRVDRDSSDTYAKEMFPGLSTDDAILDTLELANPDKGSVVEWGTVQARDPGAARLMRPAQWTRVPAKQLTYWRLREHAPLIREGMARALWVTSYAKWVEEQPAAVKRELSPHGDSWDSVTPDNPESADDAMAMYESFEMRNGVPMGELLERAMKADGRPGTDEDFAEKFGHYLAMQALGEGVSWFDDHAQFPLVFPEFEAWTDDGETLDWSPRRNPRRK